VYHFWFFLTLKSTRLENVADQQQLAIGWLKECVPMCLGFTDTFHSNNTSRWPVSWHFVDCHFSESNSAWVTDSLQTNDFNFICTATIYSSKLDFGLYY